MNNILLNKGQFSSFSPEINAKNDENSWGLARWTKQKGNCPWTISCQCSKYYSWILIGVCYYRIIQESGIKTDFPIYVVGVFSGDKMIAEGTVTYHYVHVVLGPFRALLRKLKKWLQWVGLPQKVVLGRVVQSPIKLTQD